MRYFFLCFFFIVSNARGQQLTLTDLRAITDMQVQEIDRFLISRGYTLSQNDSSYISISRYYTSVNKKDSLSIIRSLSWTKAAVNNYEGVLVLYRTYDEKEQAGFVEFIKSNEYKLSESFRTAESEEFIYSKGDITIRNIITVHRARNGRQVRSFAIETGK